MGFFVSVRIHFSREVLQNLLSFWGKVKRRVFEPVCWEQRAGRGREITACKISGIQISSFATSLFQFIMLFHICAVFCFCYFHWTTFQCNFFFKVTKTMCQILSKDNLVRTHWMLYTSWRFQIQVALTVPLEKVYFIWGDSHVSSQALNPHVLKQNLGPEGQWGYFTSRSAFAQTTLSFCSGSVLR